jgi:GR25 family glycosyltransferase involved in LPS biosynthesis
MPSNYKKWKAYILSVKDSDRRIHVENLKIKLESNGIETVIIDAIYYKNDDVLQMLYNNGIIYDCPEKTLSLSQIGCFLSHRKVWELIACSIDTDTISIIIEDDMDIDENNFNLDYLFPDINGLETFDGLILWKHPDQIHENPKEKTLNLLDFYYQWGLCVYCIIPQIADILLKSINRFYSPVDQILFGEFFPKMSIYMCKREHFLNLGKLSSFDFDKKHFKSLIWA